MLTAVSPATGLQGGSVPVTLSGTHFVSGATIAVSNPLIGATKVRAVSSTQITAELFVRAGAAVGPATITVTTFAGTSNPVTFTVGEHETIPPPGYPNGPLSGISGMLYQYTASPATSNLGHVVEYSFDWGDGSQSGWMPQGVTTSSHTWTTPGTYVVGARARCMTHTAVSIRSARVTISVTANPPPVLASISPAAGQLAFSEFVTISGSGFVAGATVAVSDPEVIVSNVTIVNSTQITATFAIGFGASLGAANVTVTTPAGTSNAVPFTIGSQPPAINVLSPASLARNSGQDVMIMGSFFTPTATVAVSNPGVSVLYPMAYGSNIMSAIFMVAADAPLGPCNVTVTTASGTSAAAVFTVR